MRVYASIAHRGAVASLAPLVENVLHFVRPVHVCVFAHSNATFPNATTFFEEEAQRRLTPKILLRHLNCASFLNRTFAVGALDVLVFVAANQRFFRPCHPAHGSFSFEAPGGHTGHGTLNTRTSRPLSADSFLWRQMLRDFARGVEPVKHCGTTSPTTTGCGTRT